MKDHPILWRVREKLCSVTGKVAFQWVVGHCGLPGNERADQVAKEVAEQGRSWATPQVAPVTFKAAKLSVKIGVVDRPTQHEDCTKCINGR